MEMHGFDLVSLGRMMLVFVHILAVVAAGIGIAFGDYAIFSRNHIDNTLLHKAGKAVTIALCVLWATGLGVIWLDTHFLYAELATKPKLLAKLTVVTVLTINGIGLHHIAFKRLLESSANEAKAARLPAILGGISAATWVYAAFLGLAKPAAAFLGYTGLMALYGMALVSGIVVAMWFVRPRLAHRLAANSPREHASEAVVSVIRDIANSKVTERKLLSIPSWDHGR